MSHVLTYPAHTDKHAAVIGSQFLHDLALSALVPAGSWVHPHTQPLSALSQTAFMAPPALHLSGAAQHVSAHDIPALGRLLKSYPRVVISGSHWADPEVESWWGKSSTRKIFDSTKMSTKTSRRLLQQWVSQVSSLSPTMATHACEQVRYDPSRAVALARKVAVFDGDVSGSDITTLAQDFLAGDFVEHLLQMRSGEALAAAASLDEAQCRAALGEVTNALPLSLIHI